MTINNNQNQKFLVDFRTVEMADFKLADFIWAEMIMGTSAQIAQISSNLITSNKVLKIILVPNASIKYNVS